MSSRPNPRPDRDKKVEMSQTEHHASRMPANDARQGVTQHGVRYVLYIGLALVIIAFAIIYFMHF